MSEQEVKVNRADGLESRKQDGPPDQLRRMINSASNPVEMVNYLYSCVQNLSKVAPTPKAFLDFRD